MDLCHRQQDEMMVDLKPDLLSYLAMQCSLNALTSLAYATPARQMQA